jgi:indole-3-acetate monooxygenase
MDILDQCEVMETLGYHDASAAWVAMVGSDSGHYAARIDETEARALYPSLDLLTSGAIAPMGQAHIVDRRIEGQRAMEFWQRLPACRPPGWRLRSV